MTYSSRQSSPCPPTNRDPVVECDDGTIRSALDELSRRGWVRLASGPGSRAAKFRHLLSEALRVSDAEISLLAVLMLRGPQTPGELKQRTERLYAFEGLGAVEAVLQDLIGRELVARLQRRPGQKEERSGHLLGEAAAEPELAAPAQSGLEERVARLEEAVRALEERLASPS